MLSIKLLQTKCYGSRKSSINGTVTAIKEGHNKKVQFTICDTEGLVQKCAAYSTSLSTKDIGKGITITNALYENNTVMLTKDTKIYRRTGIPISQEIRTLSEKLLRKNIYMEISEFYTLDSLAGYFSFTGQVKKVSICKIC